MAGHGGIKEASSKSPTGERKATTTAHTSTTHKHHHLNARSYCSVAKEMTNHRHPQPAQAPLVATEEAEEGDSDT